VEPLLAEVKQKSSIWSKWKLRSLRWTKYQTLEDLEALKEIRELIQQRYLEDPEYSRSSAEASSTNFQRYRTLATLKC